MSDNSVDVDGTLFSGYSGHIATTFWLGGVEDRATSSRLWFEYMDAIHTNLTPGEVSALETASGDSNLLVVAEEVPVDGGS